MIQNPGLTLDGELPVFENQVIIIGQLFIEAKRRFRHVEKPSPSLDDPRDLAVPPEQNRGETKTLALSLLKK